MRRFMFSTVSLLALLGATAARAQEAPQDSGALEEITVTAQRTDQRLQDVPVSVTAISAKTIDRLQIQSPSDLNRIAPNVKFDSVTGGTTGLKPYIRGGGVTDGAIVTSESEVAIYVDDVYRARLSGSMLEFVELDRIEVLRGPQGVLYGRNSSAGAVNIITKAPSDVFGGTVQAGYGTWNERRLKGYLTGPLSADGKWRASVNGLVRARDGGRQYNVTQAKKVGKENFEGVQGDLAYVGDAVDGRLTGYYMHGTSDGQYAVATTLDANGGIVPVTGSYRRVQSATPSFTRLEQYGGSLKLGADMAGGRLTSITAYSEMTDGWRQDFSGGVLPSALGLPGTTPISLFDRTTRSAQHQFSQELQVTNTAAGGVLEYIAGLYYFNEKADQTIDTTLFFAPSQTVYATETNSFAGYGQLTLNLGDKLSLVGAGRYTIDDKRLDATIAGTPVQLANSYARFTPKVGLNYKVTQDILAYASYGEGFKSGGYNGLASTAIELSQPFKPQITKAYEVGIKSDLFGRTVRINVAGFYNTIKDRQQAITTAAGAFLIENYDATLKGLELELSWRALRGLTLWGNGSLNHGEYANSAAGGSLDGNALPVFPKYQFTAGFDGDVAVGPGKLILGADYTSRDRYFSTADNLAIGAVGKQDFLNGYVGYELSHWKFQLNAKNLLNQTGSQTGFGFSVIQPRFAIDPRTVLGTVRFSF
ncbi:TonB-dependent receptor [Sphingomonas sp. OK281]|uniref:TonB-dependent receptor n=1 Tax=Sphingomonas sp. OK281 TaxID=1881067 RepID=UPI0008EDD776|nr:TonB-dependent receptor [Sphingomonas sp. OK281]SFO02526.1 iron complex outermembrane recepter protein [Sphingomonas sp. OK281]